MQENYELVQRGFRILHPALSGYIGQEFNKLYRNRWWNEVLYAFNDQRDLPYNGTYGELVDSLDIANCIRLLTRRWKEVFNPLLPRDCHTWANELMGVRNNVAHIGQQDLDQKTAERALDTMVRLCSEIDLDAADDIRALYIEVRSRAEDAVRQVVYAGAAQPISESRRGVLSEGNLLQMGEDVVQKTTLSRKVTFGGKTTIYPVYRVRLESLFYNDQNDRIATWITKYESENGHGSLNDLDTEKYNDIIENFIVESNPESIRKTQMNIALFGQNQPGVALSDGRIVDGNRRFTCLRRIQREKDEPQYFETAIMDMDIREDKKQIKLLELSTQHGEEKKVDYDHIDYAIGTYRDIIETKLLTVEEYASSTNESKAEVNKRIEIAKMIIEFLDHIKLSGQYHAAREYQVYSIFEEMMAPLRKLSDPDKKKLKTIVFNNAMMRANPDQRKFIRDIKKLVSNNAYADYFADQEKCADDIAAKFALESISTKADVDRFAEQNRIIAGKMENTLGRALLRLRSANVKNKPLEIAGKCKSLLMEVDSRLFSKLDEEERDELRTELDELTRLAALLRNKL